MNPAAISKLCLGYNFNNIKLLEKALTHSSFVYESSSKTIAKIIDSNERLEFLGDAVLEVLISDLLYHRQPALSEGDLSRTRAKLVCEPQLAYYARKLELGKFLLLGRGEAGGGGADKDSILSDALEAIIGAIYLDGGFEPAKQFVFELFQDGELKFNAMADPKSYLQEEIQKTSQIPLEYSITKEIGPSHQKEFEAVVSHNGRILGTGAGKSKKDAEREAAEVALKSMH